MTKEDVRKLESRDAKLHGGKIPKDSDVAGLQVSILFRTWSRELMVLLYQSIVDSKVKPDVIEERRANLPLPEQPPVPSDWNSADSRTVNVGSGALSDDITYGDAGASGLREPATAESSVRTDGEVWKANTAPDSHVGRQGKDNLDSLPEDALTREARRHKSK